jgi:hypothetical protein
MLPLGVTAIRPTLQPKPSARVLKKTCLKEFNHEDEVIGGGFLCRNLACHLSRIWVGTGNVCTGSEE